MLLLVPSKEGLVMSDSLFTFSNHSWEKIPVHLLEIVFCTLGTALLVPLRTWRWDWVWVSGSVRVLGTKLLRCWCSRSSWHCWCLRSSLPDIRSWVLGGRNILTCRLVPYHRWGILIFDCWPVVGCCPMTGGALPMMLPSSLWKSESAIYLGRGNTTWWLGTQDSIALYASWSNYSGRWNSLRESLPIS